MTVPQIAITEPVGPEGAPLLVLGSSLGTSSLLWSAAVSDLRAHYRVASFDHPGHGLSPIATASFSAAELAQGVLNAIDSLGEDSFFYAGVSLGGVVGLQLTLAAPDRVRAAAIVCSGAIIASPETWNERAALVRSQGTAALVVPSAARWFAPGSLERHPDVGGKLLHSLRDTDDTSYALCVDALAQYDVREQLPTMTTPILAVWGEHDAVTPQASAEEIAAGVVSGRVERIADASHLAPAEQPAVVAALLVDFFSGAA